VNPDESNTTPAAETPPSWEFPIPPRRKFQHNYARHLLFFALTFLTTTFTTVWLAMFAGLNPLDYVTWDVFVSGLSFSLPLLTILSAHEFGHYFACRAHNVDATLPYFIPAPLPLSGTLGAVIRIKEAFPSKRALFDIGVAGPIAGFVALVPILCWGVAYSDLVPMRGGLGLNFGEPLLFDLFERVYFGQVPDGMTVGLHPIGFAAWWGMLATALNLLPFGQLDGGHIMYASLGRYANRVSAVTLALVVALTLQSSSWMMPAIMMGVMALLFGFRHPRVVDEHEPLDAARRAIAVFAFVIFVLCFTPVPIDPLG
jgi:membrane-associated protease RseP (regulator of RpoE activity)